MHGTDQREQDPGSQDIIQYVINAFATILLFLILHALP
jgi:hypothetical protein